MANSVHMMHDIYHALPSSLQSAAVSAKGFLIARTRFSRAYRRAYNEMRAAQWSTREEWERLQRELLLALVNSARTAIPYYRERLPSEQELDLNQDLTALLNALPLLPKSVVRTNSAALQPKQMPRWGVESRRTSGTTGSPLQIISSVEASVTIWAAMARFWTWAGVRYGERRVSFTGNQIVPPGQQNGPYGRLDRSNNRLMMSVYHLGDRTVDEYIDTLERFQPAFLDGYPSAMAFIARRALERGRRIGIPACFPTAETLTPDIRRVIEAGFQTRVFNQYGSQEGASLITECPAGRLHVNPEVGVVEILNSDGTPTLPGEMGELVVTGLNNHLMPFIRYQIGDMARAESPEVRCECGRQMPLVAEILGRQDDVVTTPDGRRIGMLSYNVFKHGENIRESQIIQKEPDYFILKIVPAPGFHDAIADRLVEELRLRVGNDVRVDVEICEQLPLGSHGKLRSVISYVS